MFYFGYSRGNNQYQHNYFKQFHIDRRRIMKVEDAEKENSRKAFWDEWKKETRA
ncbi:MAG: hypothetical protein HWD62_12470 [Cyclobacteriaceae bacterium]|nr:MAG: hypothetical protein HWD62_12470 [Cyclobacteriaceae bacterium]